jgi:hypothetical protein
VTIYDYAAIGVLIAALALLASPILLAGHLIEGIKVQIVSEVAPHL